MTELGHPAQWLIPDVDGVYTRLCQANVFPLPWDLKPFSLQHMETQLLIYISPKTRHWSQQLEIRWGGVLLPALIRIQICNCSIQSIQPQLSKPLNSHRNFSYKIILRMHPPQFSQTGSLSYWREQCIILNSDKLQQIGMKSHTLFHHFHNIQVWLYNLNDFLCLLMLAKMMCLLMLMFEKIVCSCTLAFWIWCIGL